VEHLTVLNAKGRLAFAHKYEAKVEVTNQT
jgi:hypothetical protein